MRSRSRAARSNSIAAEAAAISCARQSRTARLLPDKNARASRHQSGIVGFADFPGAGRGAALDLVEQAGAGAIGVKAVRAGAQKKGALQGVQGAIDGPDARERTEIISLPVARAAMLGDLRRGMIAGEQNIGKRFVVAHQDVEARLHLLDEIRLEKKRLGLGPGRDEDHRRGQRDHPRDASGMAGRPRIARDPLADAFCLADIENFAVGGDHAVDAGPSRSMAPEAADDGGALPDRGGGGSAAKSSPASGSSGGAAAPWRSSGAGVRI